MFVTTCGSVFDVCAINDFYLRVLLRTLTAQQTYPGRGSISTVISSSIPFTLVHYTLNRTRFICSANEKPMAGDEGIGPTSCVLETLILPLN